VVSVDVPSGVNASTGEVDGAAIRADLTITFETLKVGLVVAPGRFQAGDVQVVPIGLGDVPHEHVLLDASVLDRLPRKTATSTKYRAGHVLVVGGSPGLTGAPALAALAAFRSDAGYVTLAVPESSLPAVSHVLEAVKRPLVEDPAGRLLARSAEQILELAERADAVVLGPGLGRSDGTRDLVWALLERLTLPVVLDADALWELEPFLRSAPTVMTPHAGELARLLETEAEEIEAHRLESVRRAASRFGATVLLKGADTLVASAREGVLVSTYGQPSLATAGTGDVLSGVIGAFLAKGLEPRVAAGAGAVAHGLASRLAPHQAGLIASDLLPGLQRALEGEGR
jgi:NAD(P)H-hydrate epimerase